MTSTPETSTLRVLLTGAAGMVGRACAADLIRSGVAVRALRHNAPVRTSGVEIVAGDLRDANSLAAAIEGCNAVVHAAAVMSGDEAALREINVEGTRRICQSARDRDVERVVFLSSATIYSGGEYLDADESRAIDPVNTYGVSKAEAETLAMELLGDRLTIFRPPSIYETGACPIVETAMLLASQPVLPLLREGTTPIDLLHAGDLAQAIRLALRSPDSAGAFNVTGVGPASFKDLVSAAATPLGASPQWVQVDDESAVDPMLREIAGAPRTLSAEKLVRTLAYRPCMDWRRELPAAVTGVLEGRAG